MTHLISLLISPLGTSLLLGGLAWWGLRFRWPRLSRWLVTTAVLWLWFWAMPWASVALRFQLEQQHPSRGLQDLPAAEAIVVLGGALDPPRIGRPEMDFGSAADRLWYAARLYHAGKAPLIVLSGGGDPAVSLMSEAQAMRTVLTTLGVPAAAMLLDAESANTRQNAANTAVLLRQRGRNHILLVTSALHMERARQHFAAQGLKVEVAPTDFEATPEPLKLVHLLPDAEALTGSAGAFKELAGQWVNRLIGDVLARPVQAVPTSS